ncbi:hypothetical protein [Nocardia arizonensis]|nr:hypothetical protein [Nocardia arizonensis]
MGDTTDQLLIWLPPHLLRAAAEEVLRILSVPEAGGTLAAEFHRRFSHDPTE